MSTKKAKKKRVSIHHGRIKGKVYPDLIRRGLNRLTKMIEQVAKAASAYDRQAKQYDHKELPKDISSKIVAANEGIAAAAKLAKGIAANAD